MSFGLAVRFIKLRRNQKQTDSSFQHRQREGTEKSGQCLLPIILHVYDHQQGQENDTSQSFSQGMKTFKTLQKRQKSTLTRASAQRDGLKRGGKTVCVYRDTKVETSVKGRMKMTTTSKFTVKWSHSHNQVSGTQQRKLISTIVGKLVRATRDTDGRRDINES
ncbi:hypothetical protein F2P79_020349 [Pimephales promelas]|nr:hypothetical protein F2P79_020349 [Pimephales promelas]